MTRIDVIELTPEGLSQLESPDQLPGTEWYRNRRLEALRAAGLTAASWNENLHPRGRDGRFIETFGFVRWLENGKWRRGQVMSLDATNGHAQVRDTASNDNHIFTQHEIRQQLYSLPKPKATLKLPDPKAGTAAPGFNKVSGQAGSNPGALYEVTDGVNVEGHNAIGALNGLRAARAVGLTPKVSDDKTEFVGNGYISDAITDKMYLVYGESVIDASNRQSVEMDAVFNDDHAVYYHDGATDEQMASLEMAISNTVETKPTEGTKFYVKTAKSEDHAKNEKLANTLYEWGGVPIPDVGIGDDGVTVSSKIVTGDSVQPISDYIDDDTVMSQLRRDFVFDAWLANWDVAGLILDNILVVDGTAFRVDAGGALRYRAQGAPKGKFFGDKATEIDSLRDKNVNAQSAKVFGKTSTAELKDGGERLAAISPGMIRRAVADAGLDDDLADTLIARRKGILIDLDIDDPVDDVSEPDVPVDETPAVEVVPGTNLPVDVTGMTWNPSLKTFEAIPVNDDATTNYTKVLESMTFDETVSTLATTLVNHPEYTPFVQYDGSGYFVSKVDFVPTLGQYELTLNHAVLEDELKLTMPGEASFSTPYVWWGNTDPQARYAEDFVPYLKHQIDGLSSMSESDLIDYSTPGGTMASMLSTVQWDGASTDDLTPGEWLRDGYFKDFVRVVSTSPDAFVVQDMKGDLHTATLAKSKTRFRKMAPGSVLPHVLDAMEAKEKIAKYNATLPPKDAPIATPSDLVIQSHVKDADPPPDIPLPGADVKSTVVTPTTTPSIAEIYVDEDTGYHQSLPTIGEYMPEGAAKGKSDDEVEALVGRTFVRPRELGSSSWVSAGVHTVKSVKKMWDGSWHVETVDQVGHTQNVDAAGLRQEVDPSKLSPILAFNIKKDGDIVVNGVKIGSAFKPSSWYPDYKVTIDAPYTIDGKSLTFETRKSGIKRRVIPMLAAPGSGGSKPKSEKAIQLEKISVEVTFEDSIKTADDGSAMTLLDGSPAAVGAWVISKSDGSTGQIVEVEKGTGYVRVLMPDGSIKGRSASSLSAGFDPDGKAPPAAPLYKKVKLADGSQPLPGQTVLEGGAPRTIIQIKEDGSVRIDDGAGKRSWISSSKLLPGEGAAKPKTASEALAGVPMFTGTAKPVKIPYAAPGGALIPQSPDAVEKYRKFAAGRKLTRDNFVPQIGMKVRDSNGVQGTIVRIAETTSGNPSTVWVSDGTVYSSPVARQPSRLWVDHEAELASGDGNPIPKVSGVHIAATDTTYSLPTGTAIYMKKQKAYIGNRYAEIPTYYASLTDGTMVKINAGSISLPLSKTEIEHIFHINTPMEKIAYVDETADALMTAEQVPDAVNPSHVWIHANTPGALEDLKAKIIQDKLDAGVVVAEEFTGNQSHVIPLPKPSTAPGVSTVKLPPPHKANGDGTVLKGAATVGGALSIEGGFNELLSKSKTGDPGSSSLYAMTDSDIIEDMAVRMQVAIDENGDEYVELRFGLLEEAVDDLATRIVGTDTSTTGAWDRVKTVGVAEIKDGDNIAVRISTGGTLKPSSLSSPNATVVGKPELVGKSEAGLDAYKVNVALASGAVASMILEARPTPSIEKYEWDPNKVVISQNVNTYLNPDAAALGWKFRNQNGVGYETAGDKKGDQIDNAGRKIIESDQSSTSQKSITSWNGAVRARYDHPNDNGFMTIQMTHPAAGDRPDLVMGSTGRRSSVNGEVLIRVKADDPLAMQKISDMMAAAGIPVEKQGQPDADSLTVMAMNKVYKQFNPTYKHLNRSGVTSASDTAAIDKTLGLIDSAISDKLGRKATLDDIRLSVDSDGRMKVVLSDDVADAIVAKANFTGAYHTWQGGGWRPDFFSSQAGVGVMSTDERWGHGILTSGMSSSTDVTYDSGNRVYLRFTNGGKSASINSAGRMYMSPRAIAKNTDWYWESSDRFGRRSSQNLNWLSATSFSGGNEMMFKRKVTPELVGYITFNSEKGRQDAIEKLKKDGVTDIGGRPLEDVLIVEGTKTMEDLSKIDISSTGEIPLSSIVAGVI